MVYSFDIFDTILARNTLTPKGIFSLMRQIIKRDPKYPITLRLNFFNIRIRAEQEAREHLTDREEIEFEEIYRIIQHQFGLTDFAMRELLDLELRMEIDHVYPINEIVFRIRQLLSSREKVILISDMYLPIETVRDVVHRVAPDFLELPIYLSSEIGLKKSTGNLFRHVLEKEMIKPSELKHLGDNHESDFKVPKSIGIAVECFRESWLSEPEMTIIDNYAREYDVTRQLVGGITRKMRLHLLRGNRFTPTVFLFAPILYGFIHHTLKRIVSTGKKRVYFISRDGCPLKLVADAIIKVHKYPFETVYIYGSRQSWRQAAIFEPHYDLHWLGENFSGADFSLRQVLGRVDDDVETLFSLLPDTLRLSLSLDIGPSYDEICQIREAMATYLPLRDHVLSISRDKRRNALKYFKKMGLLDNISYALIDIGWSGKMQHCLYALLQSENHDIRLDEYYFALDDCHAGFESDFDNNKHYYFVDMFLTNFYLFSLYLELFVQGDHGRCVGYGVDGEPILCGNGQYLRDWGVHEYYECLQTFAEEHATITQTIPYEERFHHLIKDLASFFSRPTEQMADLFGSLPFSEDQNDAMIDEFAPPLNRTEAFSAMKGMLNLRWKEASVLRSSPDVRRLFHRHRLLQVGKNITKRLIIRLGLADHVIRLLRKC
jgi:FMN phosphatase YigB (HAD superfamily)